jgi:CRISPR-associated protein Cas1
MQLVLDSKGITVSSKDGAFQVKGEKGSRTFGPGKLESIAVTANVMLEASAIRLAIQHRIPILFFNRIGKAQARLWSPYFESIATLRRQQVFFSESPEATGWMLDLFVLKTEAQVEVLKCLRKGRMLSALGPGITKLKLGSKQFENYRGVLIEECRQQLMGTEGQLAKLYWLSVGESLPRPYRFRQRSRRPAKDIFNAAINYTYGMLYSVVEGALFAAGLDPFLGILHADEYNKPTLVFDLIEVFRPWVDKLVVEQCLNKKLDTAFFTKNQYGIFLNKKGKAFIIPLFNDFLRSSRNYLHQEASVKNHIYFMAARLAQRIRATME